MTRYVAGPAWTDVFVGPSTWPPGATLLRQGEAPIAVYALDEGAIKSAHVDADGKEHTLDIRLAPGLVGAAFLVAGCASIVDVVTITHCTLRWCSVQTFLAAAIGDPRRASELHRLHCTEIVDLLERAAVMSIKSSNARLEYFLARHGAAEQSNGARLPFRQALVASFLNVTPEHLSRLLKKRTAKVHPVRRPNRVARRSDGSRSSA